MHCLNTVFEKDNYLGGEEGLNLTLALSVVLAGG